VKTVAKKLAWLTGKRGYLMTVVAVLAAIVGARTGTSFGFFDGG
jgi:hypothetical protein